MCRSSSSPEQTMNTQRWKSRERLTPPRPNQKNCGSLTARSMRTCSVLPERNTSAGLCSSSIATCGMKMSARRHCRQKSLDLAHHAIYFVLICQRNHEKFVALVKADNSVGEKPDAIEKWVTAEQPTDRCAADADRIHDLHKQRRAHGATEGPKQRRADVLCHLALEFDALAFGFV